MKYISSMQTHFSYNLITVWIRDSIFCSQVKYHMIENHHIVMDYFPEILSDTGSLPFVWIHSWTDRILNHRDEYRKTLTLPCGLAIHRLYPLGQQSPQCKYPIQFDIPQKRHCRILVVSEWAPQKHPYQQNPKIHIYINRSLSGEITSDHEKDL